jgi:hypothetical protein
MSDTVFDPETGGFTFPATFPETLTPPPPTSVPSNDPTRLREQLLHGDLISRAAAADALANLESALDPSWTIEVYDKFWTSIAGLGGDLIEFSGNDPRNDLPTSTLKVKGSSELIDVFMGCTTTMVGVTVETQGIKMAYYVKKFDYEFENGAWVGTAELAGIWDVLNYLVIWSNWLLPIQAQIPSHAVFIWALVTVIESMVAEQALRIQSGLWEFINNALSLNPDIRAWFGTLLESNGNIFQMLKTPIYVVRTNPLLDTSPLVARTVRFETCGAVIKDITRAYGVDIRVDLWQEGDEQPDRWANLTQPTYVVTVKDRSQIEGPTKTVLDSVVRTVVDAGGSFFDELPPIITGVPGMDGVYQSPLLGVKFQQPWAVLIAPEEGAKGSVDSCKLSFHTQSGWQHIVGGRSPKWLNDLMNATFAWIIDSISIIIGFTGIPSNLLDGFLNNAFLAFQLIQHYSRRHAAGPYHPAIEVMHATASAPYNIETVFAFINALWDTRGWVSCIASFRNGEVYTLGKDVFRGGLVSILYHGRTKLYTDYIENVMFKLSATERTVTLQVGDGRAEEAPLAKHQRFITGVIESINTLTLAPQS